MRRIQKPELLLAKPNLWGHPDTGRGRLVAQNQDSSDTWSLSTTQTRLLRLAAENASKYMPWVLA